MYTHYKFVPRPMCDMDKLDQQAYILKTIISSIEMGCICKLCSYYIKICLIFPFTNSKLYNWMYVPESINCVINIILFGFFMQLGYIQNAINESGCSCVMDLSGRKGSAKLILQYSSVLLHYIICHFVTLVLLMSVHELLYYSYPSHKVSGIILNLDFTGKHQNWNTPSKI